LIGRAFLLLGDEQKRRRAEVVHDLPIQTAVLHAETAPEAVLKIIRALQKPLRMK